jgi:CotH kinase protein/Lamin Tail Domain/Chitobiase/beta-hexosaminidase C-terminal domain
MRAKYIFLALTVILTVPAVAVVYPKGDLNQDIRVDIEDLAIFAEQWLDYSGCSGINCAELNGLPGVDIADFSILAENWLQDYGPPLIINEFMASNSSNSGISDPQGEYNDWIEIYNFGDAVIDLAGMYLNDDVGDAGTWQFPGGRPTETTIDPDDFIIVWADEDISDTPGLHADFKLSAGGEEIALFDTDGTTLIDSVVFSDQITDVSYGRYPNADEDWRFFPVPTPGAENDGAYVDVVADTKFSHNRGFYDAPFSLSITCATSGSEIYYTTDGSLPIENESPSAASTQYTGPVYLNSNTVIRAAAIKAGWLPTDVDTHTYIFNASSARKSVPVYSIVGDEQKSLFEPDGVMAIVGGYYSGGVWQSDGPDSYNNPMQRGVPDYEKPVSFEILDAQTGIHCQVDCGIRVAGSGYHRPRYTRGDNWDYNYDKFSLKLLFRDDMYVDKELDYPAFPMADTDKFKAIMLRGGHNDVHNPFIRDEMLRRLHKDMGGVAATGTIANLFINGEYKSFYNPSERLDHDFFRDYYDVDTDWDVITQRDVRDGDYIAWNNTLNFCRYTDLSNITNYDQAGQMIDIVDFIDYLVIQLYSGNWDWPSNNWAVSRERTSQGKFRFHCWDVEASMQYGEINKFGFDDFPNWSPGGLNGLETQLAWIYRALKANPEFKVLFADRIQKHFFYDGALIPANLENRFTELRQQMSQILPEMYTSILTDWIPNRHQIMLNKFTSEDLFPGQGPDFKVNGLSQHEGYVSSSDTITITETGGSGTIYYTNNGNDPRTPASIQVVAEGFSVLENAAKKVLVPTGDIGINWQGGSEPYDDSTWTSGTGGVGYENGSGYESYINIDVGTAMAGNNTCYVRVPFNVDGADLPGYNNLELRVRYDDGFVAYINGTEVYRVNFTGTPQWNSAAGSGHEASSAWDTFDISGHLGALQAGTNILAVHGLNISTGSSDFLISAELEVPSATIEIPAGLSPTAIEYTGGFSFGQSTELKSRILLGSGLWSALHEAIYGVGPVAESLRISEVMYNPTDPNDEFIELINVGSVPINLNLVRFTKGVDFTFGTNVLGVGGRIVVVRNQTEFMKRYPAFSGQIAGQYEGSPDNDQDKIRLRDATDVIIHEFTYKDGWYDITDGEGFSLTIRDAFSSDSNSWDVKEGWRPSVAIGGSPGYNDAGILPDPGAVVINEVLAHSHAMDPDWIELHNTTDQPINIGGWFLSDSSGDDPNIMKYQIQAGTSIPLNGYIVFYQNTHFGNPDAAGVNTPFALNEGGETVYLRAGIGGVVSGYQESENFGASATNIAFGRYVKSTLDGGVNFVPMSANTPGLANVYPQVGPVVISEIMYNTEAVNTGGEYIELHNITGSVVTLQDSVLTETLPGVFNAETVTWQFSDGIDFIFSTGTTIPASGYLIIAEDPTAFTSYYGSMPPGVDVIGPFQNDTGLSNGGEQIQIVRPGDKEYGRDRFWFRTERVTYDDDIPWPTSADGGGNSLSQKTPDTAGANYGNDVINWQATAPNPGQ